MKSNTAVVPPANNIVDFPNVDGLPNSLEQSKEAILQIREAHIWGALEVLTPIIFHHLHVAGFDFSDGDVYGKDMAFFMESMRSMMCKKIGVEHPFQRVAAETFLQSNDGVVSWAASGNDSIYTFDREVS